MKLRPIVIAGFAKDKDIAVILQEIVGFASHLVCVAANSHRAIGSVELTELAIRAGISVTASTDPVSGVKQAIAQAKEGDTLMLTGSHFVVGDFLKEVKK